MIVLPSSVYLPCRRRSFLLVRRLLFFATHYFIISLPDHPVRSKGVCIHVLDISILGGGAVFIVEEWTVKFLHPLGVVVIPLE